VSGSSTISNLIIDGLGPFNNPLPNTDVPNAFGVTITLNEQTTTSNSITVNAIHISSPGVIDVIISSAHSDINCAPAPCPHVEHDFVTGDGEEQGSSGDKAHFGFDAGHENDMSTSSGHLTHIDNLAGVKVISTDVMTYTIDALGQRTFGGHANYNGVPGFTYKAIVQDNLERGTGLDTFSIWVFDPSSVLVYTNSGTLSTGLIQIHN
jgi:hypothetical protein